MPGGRRTHIRIPLAGRYLAPVGDEFVAVEALGGIVLLFAAACALVWANSPWSDSYTDLWSSDLTLGVGGAAITEDLRHWVNDGLMTVFFFVVALEIKRELVTGELRDPRKASLPVLAAVGGMVVPALLYVALNANGGDLDGWAVPMATDLAFALGAVALFSSRLPGGLKLFLLTLAIVDDVGAIIVIAVFYSSGVDPAWLAGALGALATMLVMRALRVRHPLFYVLPGALVWLCTLESGVHATMAGVALGLLAPTGEFHGRPVIDQLERWLHPWSSFLIVPLFAIANAGVSLGGGAVADSFASRITLGIFAGLVVGKLVGIVGATSLALRFRVGRLPEGMDVRHVVGVGALGGIGFTVSLFVADLTFAGERLAETKIGILAASAVAAALGTVILLAGSRKEARS